MNRDEKATAIEEIAADIEAAEAIFAVDYRGISVPQAAELRSKLREADASFRIVKNRLTKIAADKAGEGERLNELLQGPTALTFVRGDTAQAAKAITSFNKEHDVLTFKGGFMDGTSLDEDAFKAISRLPGREVLNGQLAGVVASPLTGLVRGLGSMIQGLALQLGQIAEKGLVSGEAPAEEPKEEAPAAEETPAGTSDEVAEDADQGSQDDGAAAAAPGSEAEEAADDETPPSADSDPSLTSSEAAEGPADDAESSADETSEQEEQDETSNEDASKEEE